MQIRDIAQLNAGMIDGSKPVTSKNEALFAEFSQTLDKIVTKLQPQDKAASIDTQSKSAIKTSKKTDSEVSKNSDVVLVKQTLKIDISQKNQPAQEASKNTAPIKPDEKSNQPKSNDKNATDSKTDDVKAELSNSGQHDSKADDTTSKDTSDNATATQVSTAAAAVVANKPDLLSQKTVKDGQAEVSKDETSKDPQSDYPTSDQPVVLNQAQQEAIASQANSAKTGQEGKADDQQKQLSDQKIQGTESTKTTAAENSQDSDAVSENQDEKAVLAAPQEIPIPTPELKTNQTSEQKVDRNTANLFEKLILDRALQQNLTEAASSIQGAAGGEQNLQNLMQSQLNQQVSKILTVSSAQGTQLSAQGLQNLVNQPQKGAENTQRGEMKEAMKNLKPQIEARTMERVESALKEVARAKDGKTISVRLDPPDLGTVKIDVSLRDGALHARVVAETPQVTTLLKDKSHELLQIIRKLGLNVEKVTVAVSDQKESFSSNLKNSDTSAQQNASNQSGSGDRQPGKRSGQNNNFVGGVVGAPTLNSNVIEDHWVA